MKNNKNTLQFRSLKALRCILFLPIFSLAFLLSCSDDNNDFPRTGNNKTVYESIDETMEQWYLWNNELPKLTPSNYSSPDEYFEALLVDKDKWSFIANLDALMAFFENGTYTGYGLSFKFDQNDVLRVKLVYDESVFATEGITRGWKLLKINQILVPENPTEQDVQQIQDELEKTSGTFLFENNVGVQKEITATQKEMDQNTVLKREVIDYEGIKVAYLAFNSFLNSSEEELNEAFTYFETKNAKELVLDLRYNGGGSSTISNQLASLLTGNAFEGKTYAKTLHNQLQNSKGQDLTEAFFKQNAAYGFDRVFVITTSATASASEMLINGLKPHLGSDNVILIGSKTHGKPVGMYIFDNPSLNLAIVPICFSIVNANNEGDYYGGIAVDHEIADDLSHDFGDMEESNFKAALEYITQGNFPVVTAKKALHTTKLEFKKKGLDELIDAF